MSVRQVMRVLAVFAAAGLLACTPQEPRRFDVLLISLDSVRWDDLTFRDPELSPHLTELARRGTIFTQAISASSWTLPAHVSMFTGLPPALHGVQFEDLRIDPRTPTLPECLREGRYWGAGFWTGWYMAGEFGFERGFDTYQNAMPLGAEAQEALATALAEGAPLLDGRSQFRREIASAASVTSDSLVEMAIGAVEAAPADRPLFLFAHFFDPHYDYIPPAPWDELCDPDYEGSIDGRGFITNKRIYDESQEPARRISDRDLHHVRALYRGEIGWTDHHIGRLLEGLRERGRLDDTLIIVTADHGDEFFEHGNRGHRATLYDEVLRVPLLVVPPASAGSGPQSCDALVSLSDILPTVLDYAGLAAPQGVYGRSLRPLLGGEAPDERPVLSTLWLPRNELLGRRSHWVVESLRTSAWKFQRVVRIEGPNRLRVHSIARYDLREDPGEQEPAYELDDPAVRAGWRALEAEQAKLREILADSPRSPLSERTTGVAQLFQDDLGALGYGGGEQGSAAETVLGRWSSNPLPPLPLHRVERGER